MKMTTTNPIDLDDAVTNGLISAEQRDNILQLAAARAQTARAQTAHEESEPLEIFHGFAEIFVSIGLIILLGAVWVGLDILIDGTVASFGVTLAALGLGHYYIVRRHMLLPSILLTAALSGMFAIASSLVIDINTDISGAGTLAASSILCFVVMKIYHRFYRVPFAIFTMGMAGAGVVLGLSSMMLGIDVSDNFTGLVTSDEYDTRFRTLMTVGGLLFGSAALVVALIFDMRDPNRTGKASKCGFWLHLLAGPALINAVALQLGVIDGAVGYALTALLLLVAALFALIIDRRSFLTAGIIYLGALIAWATTGLGDYEFVVEMLVLGMIITGLGTWWHKLRSGLFAMLPSGNWRDRLPPLRP